MLKKYLALLLTFVLLAFSATPALAASQNEKKIVSLPKGEIHDGDYFAAGDIVEIAGNVNGDVYAGAGQVFVSGIINGDLIAGGGVVYVGGVVTNDVRVAGGQVEINGTVGRNVTALGGNVNIAADSKITGSIVSAAGNIHVASGASIGKEMTYVSGQNSVISDGAKIGKVTKVEIPSQFKVSQNQIASGMEKLNIVVKIFSIVSTLIIGLVLIYLYPKFNQNVVNAVSERPGLSIGIGFSVLVLFPVAIGLVFSTIIGIPLALIMLAAYLIYVYLARVFVMIWAGQKIVKYAKVKKSSQWFEFIIGLIAYYLIVLLPFVGAGVKVLVLLFGLGASVVTAKEAYSSARKKGII